MSKIIFYTAGSNGGADTSRAPWKLIEKSSLGFIQATAYGAVLELGDIVCF